jgi:hypothetical protein
VDDVFGITIEFVPVLFKLGQSLKQPLIDVNLLDKLTTDDKLDKLLNTNKSVIVTFDNLLKNTLDIVVLVEKPSNDIIYLGKYILLKFETDDFTFVISVKFMVFGIIIFPVAVELMVSTL